MLISMVSGSCWNTEGFNMTEPIRDNLVAKFDYYATESHELTVLEGERLTLLDDSSLWWKVMNATGEVGYVPSNYVKSARQNLLSNFMNSLSRKKGHCASKLTGSSTNAWISRTIEELGSSQPFTEHNRTSSTLVQGTMKTPTDSTAADVSSSEMSSALNTIVRGPKDGVFYSFNRNSHPSEAILMAETNSRDKNIQNLFSNFMNSLSRKKGNCASKLTGSSTNAWISRTIEELGSSQPFTEHNRTSSTLVQGTMKTPTDSTAADVSSSEISSALNTIVRGPNDGVFYSFNRNSHPSEAILMAETNSRDKNIQAPCDDVPAPPVQTTTSQHSQVTPKAKLDSSCELLCRVLVSYTACMSDELSIQAGDRIRIFHKSADGWWFGQLLSNSLNPVTGWFPSSLVVIDSSNGYFNLSHNTLIDIRNDESRTVSTYPTSTSQSVSAPPYAAELSTKERAITLYSFNRNQLEELSFEADEILEVIEQPKVDGEWWRCRNFHGDVGWVPSNHLRLLRSPQLNTPQHNPQWRGSTEMTPPTTQFTLSYGGQKRDISATSFQTRSPPVPPDSPNDQRIDGEALRLTHALKSPNANRYIRCSWFWGQISRAECEHMLRHFSKPGEFLIRDSHHVVSVTNNFSGVSTDSLAVKYIKLLSGVFC
ncbi:NCK adaptor protein 2 [Paragonimus westermani]|uniref:NCK adaptor protein 2 n=1 Tax=Paragonimus westermani TaxID=34504 RepID=A0A5J4NNX6_9TREM|nr:NCK adaptor protein 2 [Paragonimus westermani]